MEKLVKRFIDKHQLLKQHATVLIGVSGGPDSMALLHYLHENKDLWNLRIIALTVDHQLRGEESQEDVTYVKEMCQRWGITYVEGSLDVPTYQQEKKIGTQLAARQLRYKFFAEQMDKYQADYLALGHHGDDQVETMVMSLVRSSSTIGLSGIPVKRSFASGLIIRPFLCLTKAHIEKYCDHHHLHPRIDLSNEDTSYTRNYFRKHIIPIIKEQNHNIHTTMQQLSEALQHDERFLKNEAKHVLSKVVTLNQSKTRAIFNSDEFTSYPYALQRRTYHLILNYLYNKLPDNLSYVHEEDFFAVLNHEKSHVQINFPQGLVIEKSYQRVTFYFQDPTPHHTSFQKILNIPGNIRLPDGSVLRAKYTHKRQATGQYTYICAVENDDLPLHIRTRQAGDRMSWKGLNGRKKIKDIFIDEKIPREERDTWPIVTTSNGDILWLVGLRKGLHQHVVLEDSLFIELTLEKEAK